MEVRMRKLSGEEEKEERAAANLMTWRRMSDCHSAMLLLWRRLVRRGTWRGSLSAIYPNPEILAKTQ